jgi:4-oxalocrotonate tautomerase
LRDQANANHYHPLCNRAPGDPRRGRQRSIGNVHDFLHKGADLTAVLAEPADSSRWFVAGKSLAEHDLASFWLEIRIVEGTSTKEERERFIAGIFEAMGQLLGPMHQESYVHVHEVRADAYGFGGRTQERRFIEGRPLPATTRAD